MLSIKFSPETVIMLPFAICLDMVGIVLFCCGIDDFGMTDILGITIVDGWLFFRGNQRAGKTKGRRETMSGISDSLKKLFTDKNFKFITPTFLELIPYVGALPFWTISVIFNLNEED